MKKLFNIILLFAVIALIGYGIYYLLDISSFNVVDETIVMSTEESYLIGVYADNEAYNDPSLYKYETTDDKVAYVDENGRIISVDKGDCEITVKRGFRSYIIKVTVFEREPKDEPVPDTSNSNSNTNSSNSNSNVTSNSNTNVSVTGIELVGETLTVRVGSKETINYRIVPENATNKNVTYTTTNNNLFDINNGVVTGKKEGTGTVLIKTVDGNYEAKLTVVVLAKTTIKVTSVSATISSNSITVGSTATIKATVNPSNATDKKITFKSNNTAVATVNSSGVVKGVSAGTATITVTSNDGNKKATFTVTVKNPVHATSVVISGSSTVAVGKTITLTFTTTPANAIEKTATWSSSDATIATVDSKGVVTGKKAGKVIIYATLPNGAKSGKPITVE